MGGIFLPEWMYANPPDVGLQTSIGFDLRVTRRFSAGRYANDIFTVPSYPSVITAISLLSPIVILKTAIPIGHTTELRAGIDVRHSIRNAEDV